jgi:hypothetical protein
MDCVHHLTYARKYRERIEDLAGWCNQCHDFTHGKSDYDPQTVAREKTSFHQLQRLVYRMRQQGFLYSEMCVALAALHESKAGNPASMWSLAVGAVGGLASDFASEATRVEWRLAVLRVYVSSEAASSFLNRPEIKTQIAKCLDKEWGGPLEFEIGR